MRLWQHRLCVSRLAEPFAINVSIRFMPIAAGLALPAACGGPAAAENLANLDAKLANVAIAPTAAGRTIETAPAATQGGPTEVNIVASAN